MMVVRRTFPVLLLIVALLFTGCTSTQAPGGGLLGALTDELGVNENQALVGAGSLLGLAKERLSSDDFARIAGVIPGSDGIMKKAMEIGGVSGPIGSITNLAPVFARVGMGDDMVGKFVPVLTDFVSSAGGKSLGGLLESALK
jgi:hypothetical protein